MRQASSVVDTGGACGSKRACFQNCTTPAAMMKHRRE
jgi:hypothetical protein